MNISTIAKICGVSTTTVSRILNNKPDVSPETREKVIRVMNELEFRPMIVSGQHEKIGVVTPVVSFPEFMGELMNGLMEIAYSMDKNLTLIPENDKKLIQSTDIKHYCRSNGLQGMIVINPPIRSKLPQQLMEQGIPHVIIAASFRDSDVSWVDVDNIGGCKEAVSHLIKLGHERIALFYGSKGSHRCEDDRILGYMEALQEHGIEPDPQLAFAIDGNGIDLTWTIENMLRMEHPPTAVFCTNFRRTLKVTQHLQKLNVRIPDDISIAGFGDYDVSPLMTPPMTTVHQPIYEMGKKAAQVFAEMLDMEKYTKRQVCLPTSLIIRKSTKARNGGMGI